MRKFTVFSPRESLSLTKKRVRFWQRKFWFSVLSVLLLKWILSISTEVFSMKMTNRSTDHNILPQSKNCVDRFRFGQVINERENRSMQIRPYDAKGEIWTEKIFSVEGRFDRQIILHQNTWLVKQYSYITYIKKMGEGSGLG